MPSSPPTLLPFGSSTASVIYSNTRYLLGVIRSIMTSSPTGEQQQRLAAKHRALGLSDSVFTFPPQDMDDSICSSDPTPLDIGLLSTDTTSLDGALARTTDLVANSIRTFLKQFNPYAPSKNDVRVLVFGSHSLARAKYLSQTKDFPNLHYPVSSSPSLDSPSHGGLFYADHIVELDECDAHTFDAIITFNLSTRNQHETTILIDRLQSILRPGGCLAGTGLFHGLETENDLASITSHDTHLSVRTFRSLVETVGFFMHTSIDVSLEGNVILQVVDERMDQDVNDVLEQLRIGRLLCVRFLATKHAPMGASTPRHAQIMAVATDATPILTSSPLTDNMDDLSSITSPADGVVVTGVSLGLPSAAHSGRRVFDPTNFDALFDGMQFIQQMSDGDKQAMIDQNVFSITKIDGKRVKYKLSKPNEMIQVCSKIGTFDLAKEYGIPAHIVECLDTTYALAIAAGLEALKDAGIVLSDDGQGTSQGLPEHMRDETGVIFASSFPCIDSCIEEVTACIAAKIRAELSETSSTSTYEYNRKLLFKFLVMANCQLAEMIRARGPNTHINSACAGTTQAVSLAEDWIRAGRCRRVIVIAADNATSENLLPYIATGFLALGAASTAPTVDTAAVPFDSRRKGMILGSGAVGLVIESTHTALSRNITPKVEILGSHLANSAYHASLMYGPHISSELAVFMKKMELQHGLDRATLARDCIYYSHETGTSVCARIEMDALLASFGDARRDIIIANTKGFTGHPMGVGIEEAMAVQSLHTGRIPPIANYKCPDPSLGDLYLSTGENHTRNYAIRFAAGFGSHFVYVLYKKWGQQS